MSKDINKNKISFNSVYRPEIDGLRAFAVVAVVINHFNKEILPNGYLGVDIFFVISGFVITSSLYQRPSKNIKDFITGFYARRIKRLIPVLSIFVFITSIGICLFNPSPSISLKTGITSLFGLSNFFLYKQSTDYFAQPTELNVFMHTWSLGVEEQFYILFPFLIWFSGYGRQTKNGARNLFLTIGALSIASCFGFLYLYPINQSAAYFLMPTRFWEISSGCLLFIGLQKNKFIEQSLERIPPLLLLIFIVGAMYLPKSLATASTIAVVILSCILITSLKNQTSIYRIFTNTKVVYIGLISYSLYLWHWCVLSISRWTIGIHWWSVPFQVALTFILAITSYQWIELPLKKRYWFGKKWKTIILGGGVIIILTGGIFALGKLLKGKLFIGNQENVWNMKTYGEIKITHSPLLPTIYLIGDSIAGHYGSVLSHLADKKEFNFVMHPRGNGLKLKTNKSPEKYEEFILAPLRKYKNKFKKGDVVIFSGHQNRYYKNGENWTKLYSTFIRQTQNIGIKFVLISPTPFFSGVRAGYICQEEWFRPSWVISPLCISQVNKNEFLASEIVPIQKIDKFLLANPQVSYIDAFSILCPNKYCKNHDENKLMYKDNFHLNGYGAMKLTNTFETLFD